MNIGTFIGRFTADPELRKSPNDKAVTTFTLAVNREYKNKDGSYSADFIDMEAWGHQAEFICKYFAKGKVIGITGNLKVNSYTDKDGVHRKGYRIVVRKITPCGGISHRTSGNNPEKENQEPAPLSEQPLPDESQMPSYEQTGMDGCDFYTPNEDDDLPF